MTGTWASGWATGDVVTAAEFKKTAGAIFDSTLGASAANVDITGISATYAHLMVSLYGRGDTAATTTSVAIRFNGDAAANYDYQYLLGSAAAPAAAESFANTSPVAALIPANTAGANLFGSAEIFIPNYAGSTNNKQYVSINAAKSATTTGTMFVIIYGGGWRSNAAINQVTLFPVAGNFVAGTRVTIHALGA
jgi:hypothetical protein